jgi:enoyl-CoA hydratase
MELIEHRLDAGVAWLTLCDPKRRNALSLELVEQLTSAIEAAEADEHTGAVVITGAAPAFCAGADLSQLGEAREQGLRAIYEGFTRVNRCTLPTVAAVNGAAVGAGFNLALACDIRVAAKSARFDTRFLQLGIHPGGGHTWWLQRLVGTERAAAMVLFGQVLDGESALRHGLVWECVDDEELVETVQQIAGRAASFDRDLVRRTKHTMAVTARLAEHPDALEVELDAQLWSMDRASFTEGIAASRRAPRNG